MVEDARYIVQADIPAVDEYKGNLGMLGRCLIQRIVLTIAGHYNDLCTVIDRGNKCIIAVGVGCLAAVSRLVILVGFPVFIGVGFYALPGALIKSLVLQLCQVGHHGDLVPTICRIHYIADLIGGNGLVGTARGGGE